MTSPRQSPFIFLSVLLLGILSACNLPVAPAELSLEEQAGTLVAQTVAANETQQALKTPTLANTATQAPLPSTISPTVSPLLTPTKTPSPPAAPTLKNYNFSCSWNGNNNDLSIVIQWNDKANNETGYRIYRNGVEIISLGANMTTYTDIFAVGSGVVVNYAIEAYNLAGKSGQIILSATCQ